MRPLSPRILWLSLCVLSGCRVPEVGWLLPSTEGSLSPNTHLAIREHVSTMTMTPEGLAL